jgi:hypothetical protein
LLFAGSRRQDLAAVLGQAGKDSRDLGRRLAFSENDLRHAGPQSPMMIDFGEAEIFKRQMPHARDRVVGREHALADLLEKLADGFSVQEAHAAGSQVFRRADV